LLGLGAFIVVIALVFHSSFNFEIFSIEQIVRWVDSARANPWFSLAFYCAFAVGVMALPITLFPIIGGVLLPFYIALPLNVIAATLGGWFSMWVSRLFGRRLIEPLLKGRLKSLDRITATQGFKTVLLLRVIGVPPYIFTNYALGFSAVNNWDFWTGTMLGILPWMSIVTYASHSLWKAVLTGGEKGLMKALAQAVGPLVVLSVLVVIVLLLSEKLKKQGMERRVAARREVDRSPE